MDERVALVLGGLERLNANDPAGWLSRCSEDLTVRSPLGDVDGRERYRAVMTAGLDSIPDHWRRVDRVATLGDTVAVLLVFGATSPVTEDAFAWDAISLFHFNGDQIDAITEHSDPRLVQTAFGLPPSRGDVDAPADVVTAALDRLNDGDLEGYVSSCTDDVHSATPLGVVDGRVQFQRYLDQAFAPLAGHWRRVERLIANGDNIATHIRFGGTVAAAGETGETFELDFITIFTVRDGQIANITEYGDVD